MEDRREPPDVLFDQIVSRASGLSGRLKHEA
jgi:hypothetical protein